jgi:hypothetical protein
LAQGPPDLLREWHAVAVSKRFHCAQQVFIRAKRYNSFSWRHCVYCITRDTSRPNDYDRSFKKQSKKIEGQFTECLVNSQEFVSDDEHMTSVVEFEIFDNGKTYPGSATIKQTVGSKFDDWELEVGAPRNYTGPTFDYSQFRQLAEQYYRQLVGSQGHAFRVAGGAHHIALKNSRQRIGPIGFEIDATSPQSPAW